MVYKVDIGAPKFGMGLGPDKPTLSKKYSDLKMCVIHLTHQAAQLSSTVHCRVLVAFSCDSVA